MLTYIIKFSFILILLIGCAKEQKNHVSDYLKINSISNSNKIIISKNNSKITINKNQKILNNYIINSNKDSIFLTNKNKTIEIGMNKNTKIGTFITDSSFWLYHYKGISYISINDSFKNAKIKTLSQKQINFNSNQIILDFSNNLNSIIPISNFILIDNDTIQPGEILCYNSDSIYVKNISNNDILKYKKIFGERRIGPLLNFFKQKGHFPRLKSFLKTAIPNIKISYKIKFIKKNKNDKIQLKTINIPKNAKFSKNTLIWTPKRTGNYKFKFKIYDNNDSTKYTKFIKIKSGLIAKASLTSEYMGADSFKINFNFDKSYSMLSRNEVIQYKIYSKKINSGWISNKQFSTLVKGNGIKKFIIYFKSINNEIVKLNKSIRLSMPPDIKISYKPNTVYSNDTLKLNLSKTIDDDSPINKIKFNISAKNSINQFFTKKITGQKIVKIPILKSGKKTLIIIAKDIFNNTSKKEITVNVLKGIEPKIKKIYKGNINTPLRLSTNFEGDNIKNISIDFNDDTKFDTTITKQITNIFHTYRKRGTKKLRYKITTNDNRIYNFYSKVLIDNAKPIIKIIPLKKKYYVNNKIPFKIIAKDKDNKITNIKIDFNGDGIFEIDTNKFRNVYYYTQKRSGKYRFKVSIRTDDNIDWYKYMDYNIYNHKPIAICGNNIAPTPGSFVTIKGNAKDQDKGEIKYYWDTNEDGVYDTFKQNFKMRFKKYTTIALKVMDCDSAIDFDTLKIVICNKNSDRVIGKNGPFCIDRYEYPNNPYKKPITNINFYEAEKKCQENGKHLCTQTEWVESCKGKFNYQYPYGNKYNKKRCNTYNSNKNKPTTNQSFYQCKNIYGTINQSGNVAEWVKSYDGKHKAYGGSFMSKDFNSTCNSNLILNPNKKFFYVGFRCCK